MNQTIRSGRLTVGGGWPPRASLGSVLTVAMAMALLGVTLCLWTVHAGVQVSPDSLSYLSAAKSLAEGRGLLAADGAELTLFPPGYPALLATAMSLGLDVVTGAVAVNCVAMAMMIIAVTLAGREVGLSLITMAWLGMLVALSPTVVWLSTSVLSDLPAAAFTTWALLMVTRAMRSDGYSLRALVVAAGLVSLAATLRYAAGFFIPTVVIAAWWVFSRTGYRRPFLGGLAVGALACIGLILVMVRNLIVGVPAGGSRLASALDLQGAVLDVVDSIGQLIVPRTAWSLTTILGTVLVVTVGFVSFREVRMRHGASAMVGAAFVTVAALTTAAAALTRLDIGTTRLVLPLLPVVLLVVARWSAIAGQGLQRYVNEVLREIVSDRNRRRAVVLSRWTWAVGISLAALLVLLINAKTTWRLVQ